MEIKTENEIFIYRNLVWQIEKHPYGRRDYFIISRKQKNTNGETITIRD